MITGEPVKKQVSVKVLDQVWDQITIQVMNLIHDKVKILPLDHIGLQTWIKMRGRR